MDRLPILRLSSTNKFLVEENERVERNDFEKIAATFRKISVTNEENPTGIL